MKVLADFTGRSEFNVLARKLQLNSKYAVTDWYLTGTSRMSFNSLDRILQETIESYSKVHWSMTDKMVKRTSFGKQIIAEFIDADNDATLEVFVLERDNNKPWVSIRQQKI